MIFRKHEDAKENIEVIIPNEGSFDAVEVSFRYILCQIQNEIHTYIYEYI